MALIECRKLTRTYRKGEQLITPLKDLDLDIQAGQFLALMGPSGSGKTTLISIMGCILRPTSGSVKIQGREVSHLSEKELPDVRLQNIGFIFQGFNLFPTLTAGENVELALDLKKIRGAAARQKAAALLSHVGLSEKYHAYPSDISGGQKQRVAIARALAGEPRVILADEPTAALDSHSGRGVLEMLRVLAHQQQRAVVIVTHDPRALEFADRIVKIEDGRIAHPAGSKPTRAELELHFQESQPAAEVAR